MNNNNAFLTPSDTVPTTDKKEAKDDEPTFTIDDAIEHFGFGPFQFLISLFSGISWMAEAMEMMIMSILTPALVCDWHIPKTSEATVTSCVFVGMTISSLIWGVVCDRCGRRTGIMLISLTTFAFGMASAFAPNFTVFIILRTLMGVGIGGVPQSVTYYSEFLPVKNRALCVICMQVFWAVGGAMESLVAFVVMSSYRKWRWLIGYSTAPMLVTAGLCLVVPESIRYLVTSGQIDKAHRTLQMIARINGKDMLPGRLVESSKAKEGEEQGRIMDLFGKELLTTTLLIMPIWFIASFNYYGTVLYTTERYLHEDTCEGGNSTGKNDTHECKELTPDDYIDFTKTSFAEIPGLIVACILLQFWGRRNALTFQFTAFSVIFFLYFCLKRWAITTVTSISRSVVSGAFQTAYVYTPEVYPTSLRAVAMGMASGSARAGSTFTPFIVHSNMHITMPAIIYGASSLIAAVFTLFLPIETMGRRMMDRMGQLEDVEQTPKKASSVVPTPSPSVGPT